MKNLTVFFLLCGFAAFGQNFSVTDELSFGGAVGDILKVMPDGNGTGFIFYGSSSSDNSIDHQSPNYGDTDFWVVRTDLNYTILWEESYGGSGKESAPDAFIVNNHIYIAGSSDSPISGNKTVDTYGSEDIWMLKLAMDGTIIWQESYGGIDDETNVEIEIFQNQIIIAASSQSSESGIISEQNQGFIDVLVLSVDSLGGTLNNQAMYGSSSIDPLDGLFVFDDQIIVMTNSYGADGDIPELHPGFNEDIILFELDANLNITNTFGFAGDDIDNGVDLIKKSNNEYFLVASSQSGVWGDKTSESFGSDDVWLLKLDANFDVVWDTIYGGSNTDVAVPNCGHIDDNGSLVLFTESASITGSGNKTSILHGFRDGWVLVLNTNTGEKQAEFSFGGDQDDGPSGIVPLGNGRLLLTVVTASNISGNKSVPVKGVLDTWIIETDASNFLNISEIDNLGTATFYPNPTNDMVTLSLQNEASISRAQFFTIDGQLLMEKEILNNTSTIQFDFADVPAGVIVYQLVGETHSYYGRIVKR